MKSITSKSLYEYTTYKMSAAPMLAEKVAIPLTFPSQLSERFQSIWRNVEFALHIFGISLEILKELLES